MQTQHIPLIMEEPGGLTLSVPVWTDVHGRQSLENEPAASFINYWCFLKPLTGERATCESRWLGKKHTFCRRCC